MTHDEELDSLRKRVAEESLSLEELWHVVGVLQESVDCLLSLWERHQKHHEAVEELLDRPVGRAIVEKLLHDLKDKDDARHREERKSQQKVLRSVDLGGEDADA